MPSTDLPDPNSHLGTAGFKWHPEGSTDRPEQVHALQWPPHLVPGGGYETRRKKYRATGESIDGSNIERFTVGSGNERARMPLRFDSWSQSLGDLLEDAADGVTVDFYPRLESTNLKFPVELVDVGDVTRVRDDSDRHGFGEFEVESVWKDASTDDQGFWWMEGPNKLKNPRLARGTTDGVPEEWTTPNDAADISIDVRAVKIDKDSTDMSPLEIEQIIPGAVVGDIWKLSVEAKAEGGGSTDEFARVELRAEDDAKNQITEWAVDTQSTSFTRIEVTSTQLPSSAVNVEVGLQVRDTSTGVDNAVNAFFRDAKLTLQ